MLTTLLLNVAFASTDLVEDIRNRDPQLAHEVATWEPIRTRAGFPRFINSPGDETDIADVAVLLAQRLTDESEPNQIRYAAAMWLAESADNSALISTAFSTETSPEIRVVMTDVFKEAPSQVAIDGLLTAMADPDPRVRTAAARIVGYRPEAELTSPTINQLSDPNPAVRAFASRALGWRGNTVAFSNITTLLNDIDPDVRLQAIIALDRLDSSAAMVLPEIELLCDDADPRVQRAAMGLRTR